MWKSSVVLQTLWPVLSNVWGKSPTCHTTHRERNCKNKQNDKTVESNINFMNMTMRKLNTQKYIVVSTILSFHLPILLCFKYIVVIEIFFLCVGIIEVVSFHLRGPYPPKKTLLFIRLWWKFAHICKIEIKMGILSWTFFHLFHRKPVIPRKRKKGGFAVMNRTVERFILHSWYSYQSKRNFMLYKIIESFFFRISF